MAETGPTEATVSLVRRWMEGLGELLGHRAIPPMAAALAYRTVFSIIPICIIGIMVVGRFINRQSVVDDLFGRIMEWLGVAQISVSTEETTKIDTILRRLAESFDKVSFTGIGIVSGFTLIYAAISLLIELETTFNKLYNAPRGRSLVRRIMQYWLLVSLGPVLVAGSFIVAERITGIASLSSADMVGGSSWLLNVVGFLSSVAISTLALWLLYISIPNTRVKVLPALYGALAGAVALEIAKYGFHVYLERAALKSIYGSLALIPIFLLWVYTTWMVVLTGLRISYLIQHGRRLSILNIASGMRANGGGGAFVDPAYSVAVACDVAKSFARGEPRSVEEVAERVRMTDQAARTLLARLIEARIVLEVQTGGAAGRERYVLSRPAESIAVEDILRCGFAAAGGGTAIPPQVAAMRTAQLAAVTGRTLADEIATRDAAAAQAPPENGAPLAGEGLPAPAPPVAKPLLTPITQDPPLPEGPRPAGV